jgi:iron(III) transport system permease protein
VTGLVADRPIRRSRVARLPNPFSSVTGVIAVVVSAVILVPLVIMLISVFLPNGTFSLSAFAGAFGPGVGTTILNTIVVVLASTLISLVVGSLFAWLTERTDASFGFVSEALPVIPMMVPPLAGAIGWVLLATPGPGFLNGAIRGIAGLFGIHMGLNGPLNINSWAGLIFVYTLYLLPQVYLVVAAGLRNLDPALEEASRLSGASVGRTLRKITMPAMAPSLGGAFLLALVSGFALYSVPVLLGPAANIDILSVRIVRLTTLTYPPQLSTAIVLGLVMVVFVGGASLLQRRIQRAGRFAQIGGRHGSQTIVKLGAARWPARVIILLYLAATSVLPLLALIIVSLQPFWTPAINVNFLNFSSYQQIFSGITPAKQSLIDSLLFGILGATVTMLIAAMLAYYSQQHPRFFLARLAGFSTKIPATVSHVVIAIGLIVTFAGAPFHLQSTFLILFIAYLILYLPQASVTAGAAVSQLGKSLPEAALLSGASQTRTFRTIVLPLMTPGLIAGWVFVFVLVSGDLTASFMLAGNATPVVGQYMLDLVSSSTYPALAAMGVIISVVSSAVSLSVLVWSRRRSRRAKTPSRATPVITRAS